jgi:hydrogenase maturation protease
MTEVLVAGLGNIFAGDDAFGVEVAQRLATRTLPPGTRVVDFGIRAIDLAYALADGCDAAVLVDAASRGEAPGTLYVIEPECGGAEAAPPLAGSHALDADAVLRTLPPQAMRCRRIVIVGCEPQTFGDEFDDGLGAMGLSAPVARAVDPAVDLVAAWAARLQGGTA